MNTETKPEYFRLHEVEDKRRFDALEAKLDNLPCKEDLDNAIKGAVELHVNGKIREVDGKVTNLHSTLNKYIEDDMQWKKTANPAVASYQKGSAFFSVLGAGTQFLLPIFGVIGIIASLIMWLRN